MKINEIYATIKVDTSQIREKLKETVNIMDEIADARRKAIDSRISIILSDFFQEEITIKNAEKTFKRLDDMGLELCLEFSPPLFAKVSIRAGAQAFRGSIDTKIYIRIKKEADHDQK